MQTIEKLITAFLSALLGTAVANLLMVMTDHQLLYLVCVFLLIESLELSAFPSLKYQMLDYLFWLLQDWPMVNLLYETTRQGYTPVLSFCGGFIFAMSTHQPVD